MAEDMAKSGQNQSSAAQASSGESQQQIETTAEADTAALQASALSVPVSDEARCTENTEDLHGFGVFSYDTRENEVHYDHYAAKYDGM